MSTPSMRWPLSLGAVARAPASVRSWPLWPLPVVAAMLPALASLIALLMYGHDRGAFCNAFIDDCVSISRMAKYGLANEIFHALVVPGAVLQGLTWLVAADRLASTGARRRQIGLMLGLGLLAAVTLVVYGSFLGSDGATYRWLRRWGPLMYFGGTYLAMLLFARCVQRLPSGHVCTMPPRCGRAMTGLLVFVAAVSLCHGFAAAGPWSGLEDRIENLSEWWGSSALTLAFLVMGLVWRSWGLALSISPAGPGE